MSIELYDKLKEELSFQATSLKIIVKTRNEETDYTLSKNIINLIKPQEEEAKIFETKEGKKIFQREYSLKDAAGEIAYKLMTNLNTCFIIKISGNEIEIEDIECPPCEKDAYSEIPKNHYILENGRVIEEVKEKTYRVYTCRVKPPS